MITLNKKFKILLASVAVLLLCGGGILWAQHKENEEKNELVPVRVYAWEQTGDTMRLLTFFVNRRIGGTPGEYCCVMLPEHWRPGLSIELYWDYTAQSKGSPPPQTARVEIEKYKPEDVGNLNIHFYPNHRVRVIVARRGFGSPFYPLPKEEWINWGVDETLLRNWKENYYEWIKLGYIPNDEDWKWAAQWGLFKEEAMSKGNVNQQEK